MRRKVGAWTLAWAQGPGRQSGLWTLSAAALMMVPFLDIVRPTCDGVIACQSLWDKVFFLPNLLFVPAILLMAVAAGSWVAQRLHARYDKRFYARLEARDAPEIPPGHERPEELERDLTRRTMRWSALGALGAVGAFVYFAMTPIGRRSCDPWQFKQPTGLDVCQGAAQWSDALIAYEVWLFIGLGFLWAAFMANRARRFRTPRAPAMVRGLKRAKTDLA